VPEPETPTKRTSLAAVGIAVADLGRSSAFYADVFGLTEVMKLNLAHMDEVILGFPGRRGAAVVLMQYTNGTTPVATGDPVKVVFNVPDPVATADRVAAAGGKVVMRPEPVASMGGTVLGFAKDPDGYLLELLQA
jgi:lactoylglutathione lyase